MKHPNIKCIRSHLQWRSRLICVSAALLSLVLSAQAQMTADPNPVKVPSGQASATTTITWKVLSYDYCVIYLSVDNGEWTEFARGTDDSKPATLKLGSSYTFRCMFYVGEEVTERAHQTLTVTTKPSPSSSPGGGGGAVFRPVGKNKNPGSAYSFAINNVQVSTRVYDITIKFNGPPNQVPYVAIGRAAPIMKNGEWSFGDNLVGGGFVGPGMVSDAEKAKGEYTFTSDKGTTISNDGLEPGATYYYIIAIPAPVGTGRRVYQDTGKFTLDSEVNTAEEQLNEDEKTGTTSSALTTKPPVKAIGRIKLPPGPNPNPPISICESAREARARNSPAAPGLEEKCRADLALKGATIAQVDPIVAKARTVEADLVYQQGFDIASGIFGDPALGAQGNTATGPGSLKIRDSLSAAGQRGFDASVKLHLSRNYKR